MNVLVYSCTVDRRLSRLEGGKQVSKQLSSNHIDHVLCLKTTYYRWEIIRKKFVKRWGLTLVSIT